MKTSLLIYFLAVEIWFLSCGTLDCLSQNNLEAPQPSTEIHQDLFLSVDPILFLPELFSSKHRIHSSPTFSPDMNEVYWSVLPRSLEYGHKNEIILFSTKNGVEWSSPKIASFSGKYPDGGPLFSPDGGSLYFYSRRPVENQAEITNDYELWFVERQGKKWDNPQHLGLNFEDEKIFFSMNNNMDIYFTSGHGDRGQGGGRVDIYFTEYRDGTYSTPKRLPYPINSDRYLESDPLISPDGGYLLFFSFERPTNHGQYDIYISYSDARKEWSTPVNLGMKVNKGYSRFPRFSPDKKYIFFVRPDGVYRIESSIISNAQNK